MASEKHYIGFEIKIPQGFKEKEDLFVEQLAEHLTDLYAGKIVKFRLPDGGYQYMNYTEIFTGKWDFTKIPTGW